VALAGGHARHNGLMATHVALLRGINLGGRNRVAMADLRAVVGELGHTGVSTYIQSGNVLFTAPPDAGTPAIAQDMTAAIAAKLGVTAPVVVVTPAELEPRRVHAVVLSEPPGPELLGKLDAAAAQAAAAGVPDSVRLIGRTLYVHTPAGYGTSDLAQLVIKIVSSPKAGTTGTARNWATMTKLLELCDG